MKSNIYNNTIYIDYLLEFVAIFLLQNSFNNLVVLYHKVINKIETKTLHDVKLSTYYEK